MFFPQTIPIPLDTKPGDPLRTRVVATAGILKHIWIRWRWGIGNLGGCRILYREFQHWPLSLGEWFPSSDASLDFEVDMEITGDPAEFVVESYNLDDSYRHTLWVAFNVLRPGPAPLTAGELMEMFATPALPPTGPF